MENGPITLGKTDIKIPAYALGTWAMGGGDSWGENNNQESIKTIHHALEMGLTFIDTAPAYGNGASEVILKRALKGRCSECILATKCGLIWGKDDVGSIHKCRDGVVVRRNLSKQSIIAQTEASLRRLGTDYIDLLLAHWPAREPYKIPIAETVEAFELLVKQGKIRSYGACNVNTEELAEYQRWGAPSLIQQRFSLLHRENSDLVAIAENSDITFQAYSPLERGALTGKAVLEQELTGSAKQSVQWYKPECREGIVGLLDFLEKYGEIYSISVSALVLCWTKAYSNSMNVLFGARKREHLAENTAAININIPAEVFQEIEAKAQKLLE